VNLKELIQAMVAEMGQIETAKALGLAQPTICRFVEGKRGFGLIALRTIVANKPDMREAVKTYWKMKL
jgi:predicted transcriptional regulator